MAALGQRAPTATLLAATTLSTVDVAAAANQFEQRDAREKW